MTDLAKTRERLQHAVIAQFGNPHGAIGRLAGMIMAHRPSNVARNRWTVGLLDVGPSDRVLEIGCGPGLAIAEAASRMVGGQIVGVDHSPLMIAAAQKRNRKEINEGRVRLLEGYVEDVPVAAGPFDKAFSVNVIQFIDDKPAFFAAIRARLRPGGTVATTYMPRHPGAKRADAFAMAERIAGQLRAEGFVEVTTAELPMDPVPAISVLARAA